MTFRARPEAGFTLIELMVAIVLALILTGGVMAMFLAGTQAYRTAEGQARVQENARFAMEYMARYVRMAGYNVDPFEYPPVAEPLRACHETANSGNTCLDDNGNPIPGALLAVRYHGFAGDFECDGAGAQTKNPPAPAIMDAVFTRESDTNAGGQSLHCNGLPVVRGIQAMNVTYLAIDADGSTTELSAAQVNAGNRIGEIGAVKLDVTVDTADGSNPNPGLAGGDELARRFRTTVYLRNLCEACEKIIAEHFTPGG